MPEHLFVSEADGSLYDTRNPYWHKNPPLRKVYRRAFRKIDSTAQLKATLRHGPYVFPGAYTLYFVTADGLTLSFEAVRQNLRDVLEAIKFDLRNTGWRVVGCDVVESSEETIYCDVTGELIE